MLLTIDAVLLSCAAVALPLVVRAGRAARRRAEAEATSKLAEAGLQANGDLLGSFVARPVEGDDVLVSNRTRYARPGIKALAEEACVAILDVLLVDQIVCRSAEVDAVMGPLPAVPRRRTGHGAFDAEYAVFVGVTGGAEPAGSYRAAPAAGDVPWAQPALLDRLMELDLLWMRVRDGRLELAFPPLETEDVGRVAALALAIEHIARGGSAPALVAGPRLLRSPRGPRLVIGSWFGAIPMAIMGGMPLALLLGSLDVDGELACGAGHHLAWRPHGHGYSLSCSPSTWDQNIGLYFFACMLLALALIGLVGAAIAARQIADSNLPPTEQRRG